MVIRSGLVSVTFRALSPQVIVALAARAGVDGIEWGGDVHVPHGDLATARLVRRITEDAGLVVASYGSYYRAGVGEPCPFEVVAETAEALGASTIRVWAGKKGSLDADSAYRDLIVQDSRRIANLAAQSGATVAYEWHGGTLTDSNESARWLLDNVDCHNIKSYWQPALQSTLQYNLAGIEMVQSCLSNVHVYHWRTAAVIERMPLASGEGEWMQYLQHIAVIPGERFAMLEFVRDDTPEGFLTDAATLKTWLARQL
jgi:3-dehydroshikimate dehydratase